MPTDPESLIAEARRLAEGATADRDWYKVVAAKSRADAEFVNRSRSLVPELANSLEVAEKRCAELEYLIGTISVDPNDDPKLTCALCSKDSCDLYFRTHSGGVAAWYGVHAACRLAARAALERKPDGD